MSRDQTLLIIPGSFATAQMYYTLLDEIAKVAPSLKAYVNNLPSAIRNPPERPASLADDAEFFQGLIKILADRGDDITLMAHSYGGVVGTECVRGLTKADREKQGKTGGVWDIVLLDQSGDIPKKTVNIGDDGFMRLLDVDVIARSAFDNLPHERALEIVKSMGRHSILSFHGRVTHAGYRDVPVSWILCENDSIISPGIQREYIKRIESESGKRVDLHTLATGHSPNITVPAQLAEVLVRMIAA